MTRDPLPLSKVLVDGGEVERRLTVILDTNVLLSDPEALHSFPGTDIVLPLTVIEELDDKKTRMDEVGYAARATVRLLEKYRNDNGGRLQEPVDLPGGSTLCITINGLQLHTLAQYHLPEDKPDNRIIAAALGLMASGRRVRIVSLDGSMRLKAAHLGLEAEEYIPEDSVTDATSPGWSTVELDDDRVISLVFKQRATGVDMDELTDDEFSAAKSVGVNEFAVLRAGRSSALVRRVQSEHGDYLVEAASGVEVSRVSARSKEQTFALNLLSDPNVPIVALDGPAGTGKTLLALATGIDKVFGSAASPYQRLMILRPMVAVGRQDMGFLPGDKEEKLGPWFEAVVDTMVALRVRPGYEEARKTLTAWQQKEQIVLDAVTHLRGRSLHKTFVLVDEAQNLSPSVLKTILTRIGQDSKVVFLGDVSQIDDPYLSLHNNALNTLKSRFAGEPLFGHVTLTRGERSSVATLAAERL